MPEFWIGFVSGAFAVVIALLAGLLFITPKGANDE